MKKTIFLLMGILAMPVVLGDVIISQVLYNPINESGSEAVELYNTGSNSVDLSGYVIYSGSYARDYAIPEGSTIPGKGYFLIADTGFSTAKDNPEWPNADFEASLTLSNTNSGVLLTDGQEPLDAVGWGNPNSTDFYETEPSSNRGDGDSLRRRFENSNYIDTDNNSNDFIVDTTPMLRSSSSSSQDENKTTISIIANVTNGCPDIVGVTFLNYNSGYLPDAGKQKRIDFEAEATDTNGVADIKQVRARVKSTTISLINTENLSDNNAIYSGSFYMNFYDSPDVYPLNITVTDLAGCSSTFAANFSYLEVISIDTDASTIYFSSGPGSSDEAIGDLDMQTDTAPTIQNIGNSPIDIWISGTDLSYNAYKIESESIEYTFLDDVFSEEFYGLLGNAPEMKSINLEPGSDSFRELSLRFTSPSDAYPGSYSAKIELFASVH